MMPQNAATSPQSPSDPDASIRAFMHETLGIDPGRPITWNGKIHRFPGKGKNSKNDAGWYRAFEDRRGGVFGDHSQGVSNPGIPWQMKREQYTPQTPEQREQWRKAKEEQAMRKAEKQDRAAKEVQAAWKAAVPANKANLHPYLEAKHIDRGIDKIRVLKKDTKSLKIMGRDHAVSEDILLIPMRKDGSLVNVQRIFGDSKRYWPGAEVVGTFCPVGGAFFPKNKTIYLCEGWATGWSISECMKAVCVVAFNAGGLLPVAKQIRKKYGSVKLIIAADNDRWTSLHDDTPNPGVHYATKVAEEVDAEVAIPDFKDLATKPTDFSDLHRLEGVRAVKKCLNPKQQRIADPKYPEEPDSDKPASTPPGRPIEPKEVAEETGGEPEVTLRAELVDLAEEVDAAGAVEDDHRDTLDDLRVAAREIAAEDPGETLAERVRKAGSDHAAFGLVQSFFEEQAPPKPMEGWYDAPLPEAILWRCGSNSAPGDEPAGAMMSVGEVTVLSGPGGLGKSTLSLAVAAGAAAGMVDKKPVQACGLWVRPGPVVIQNHEDAPARMKTRLKWYAKKDSAAWKHIFPVENPRALWRMERNSSGESHPGEGWQRLWRLVRETRAKLVILDAAKYIFPGAPNADPGPIAEFYRALSAEAEQCGCGVLIVAHDTKAARNLSRAGEDPGASTVAGSASWQDSARGVLYLHRDLLLPERLVVEAVKANYGPDGWGVLLGIRTVPFRGVDPQFEETMDRITLAARKAKAAKMRQQRTRKKKTKSNERLEGFD